MTELPWGFSDSIPDNIDEMLIELRRGSEWLGYMERSVDSPNAQIKAMRLRMDEIEEAILGRVSESSLKKYDPSRTMTVKPFNPIGKRLFDSMGRCAGKITQIVTYAGQLCFEVDDEENKGLGKYWEINRLGRYPKPGWIDVR